MTNETETLFEEIKTARQIVVGDDIRRFDGEAHQHVIAVDTLRNGDIAITYAVGNDDSVTLRSGPSRKYRVI